MVAKYTYLSFVACSKYSTTGGPPVENNPVSVPPKAPARIPLGMVGVNRIRVSKNKKYALSRHKAIPNNSFIVSCGTVAEKYTATGMEINAAISTGSTSVNRTDRRCRIALYEEIANDNKLHMAAASVVGMKKGRKMSEKIPSPNPATR